MITLPTEHPSVFLNGMTLNVSVPVVHTHSRHISFSPNSWLLPTLPSTSNSTLVDAILARDTARFQEAWINLARE